MADISSQFNGLPVEEWLGGVCRRVCGGCIVGSGKVGRDGPISDSRLRLVMKPVLLLLRWISAPPTLSNRPCRHSHGPIAAVVDPVRS